MSPLRTTLFRGISAKAERIRDLQQFLEMSQLIVKKDLSELSGKKIGIDVISWLRTMSSLKDPFSDVLGCIPSRTIACLDAELAFFKDIHITPVFVFQGIEPSGYSLNSKEGFVMYESAWKTWSEGATQQALTNFALASTRITIDILHVVFHYLQKMGCETFCAPYFSFSQLSHMVKQGEIDSHVFGPPGSFLFDIPDVILQMTPSKSYYTTVNYEQVLKKTGLTRTQFVDVCLLAGCEYVQNNSFISRSGRTEFPQLISHVLNRQGQHDIILRMLESFCDEEGTLREGFDLTYFDNWLGLRTFVRHPFVLSALQTTDGNKKHTAIDLVPFKLEEQQIANLPSHLSNKNVPKDFGKVIGHRLPIELYLLASKGYIEKELLVALSRGVWLDSEDTKVPVETLELREVLSDDIMKLRVKALGLLLQHLPDTAQIKKMEMAFNNYPSMASTASAGVELPIHTYGSGGSTVALNNVPASAIFQKLDCSHGIKWQFEDEDLRTFLSTQAQNEKSRHGYPTLGQSLRFQKWLKDNGKTPETHATKRREPTDSLSFVVLQHLMFLDALKMFVTDSNTNPNGQNSIADIENETLGKVTVFGLALEDIPRRHFLPCLLLLQLMTCGTLSEQLIPTAPNEMLAQSLAHEKKTQEYNVLRGQSSRTVKTNEILIPNPLPKPESNLSVADERAHQLLYRLMSLCQVTYQHNAQYPTNQLVSVYDCALMHERSSVHFFNNLSSFLAIAKVMLRTLRYLSEGCLAALILSNSKNVDFIPSNIFDPAYNGCCEGTPVPNFMLNRSSLGLIMYDVMNFHPADALKYIESKNIPDWVQHVKNLAQNSYLKLHLYGSTPESVEILDRDPHVNNARLLECYLRLRFPQVSDPLRDLQMGFECLHAFNKVMRKVATEIEVPTEVAQDLKRATEIVKNKIESICPMLSKIGFGGAQPHKLSVVQCKIHEQAKLEKERMKQMQMQQHLQQQQQQQQQNQPQQQQSATAPTPQQSA